MNLKHATQQTLILLRLVLLCGRKPDLVASATTSGGRGVARVWWRAFLSLTRTTINTIARRWSHDMRSAWCPLEFDSDCWSSFFLGRWKPKPINCNPNIISHLIPTWVTHDFFVLFCCCSVTTQLVRHLQQERTQLGCSNLNKEVWKRRGLAQRHSRNGPWDTWTLFWSGCICMLGVFVGCGILFWSDVFVGW